MANLTNEDKNILHQLNIDVINTIKKRRDWLDSKMQEYAEMQIGDNIYNLETGLPVGIVSKLYRLWRDTDEGFRDKVLEINYEYRTKQGWYDNTSRQPHQLGSRERTLKTIEQKIKDLNNG